MDGFDWLCDNWWNLQPCILADEMGLVSLTNVNISSYSQSVLKGQDSTNCDLPRDYYRAMASRSCPRRGSKFHHHELGSRIFALGTKLTSRALLWGSEGTGHNH